MAALGFGDDRRGQYAAGRATQPTGRHVATGPADNGPAWAVGEQRRGPFRTVRDGLLSSFLRPGCGLVRCTSGALAPPVDLLGHGIGGGVVQAFDHALVGVAGEGGGGVAELFLDDFDVDTGVEGHGGGAVAQVVQPDRGYAGAFDEAPEAL